MSWKEPYFRKRRVPLLARSAVTAEAVREWANGRPDDVLLSARHHPDHTDAAKAVLTEFMLSRGVTPAAIAAWSPPVEDHTAPAFAEAAPDAEDHADRLVRAALRRDASTRRVTALLALGAVAGLVTGAGLAALVPAFAVVGGVAAASVVFAAAALTALITAALDRAPARLVVFHAGDSAGLSGLMRRTLSGFGFATAYDIDARPSPAPIRRMLRWALACVTFGAAWSVIGERVLARVRRESDALALKRALRRRTARRFSTLMSRGRAARVAASPAWAGAVAATLARSSDVRVLDLSRRTDAMTELLARVIDADLPSPPVLIARADCADAASAVIAAAAPGRAHDMLVSLYSERGTVQAALRNRTVLPRDDGDAALRAAVAHAAEPVNPPAPAPELQAAPTPGSAPSATVAATPEPLVAQSRDQA